MPIYQRQDHYYRAAKNQGLPSRASFKIKEILKRFKLIQQGDWTLDLGAAPGGWTVILSQAVGPKGQVLAVDLSPLSPKPSNVDFLQEDLFSPKCRTWLKAQLKDKKLSAVFSDMSPKLSGVFFRDAFLSYELSLGAFELAKDFLKKGGHLVTKIFPGEEFPPFLKKLKSHFGKVKTFEPQATRKSSREVYILAMNYLGK